MASRNEPGKISELEVCNWEKYNPRGDSSRPSWFRMENNIATGDAFFGLDCEQKWLWVFILSLVSQRNGKSILWNAAYCTAMTGMAENKQTETIGIFEKYGRLRVTRASPVRDAPATDGRTDVTRRTNETNETNIRATDVSRDLPPLAKIWNQHRGTLPEVKACGAQRRKAAEARWKENPSTEYWGNVIDRMSKSKFCRGEGKNSWRADFDFLIKPETQYRVLEGKYDNRQAQSRQINMEELDAVYASKEPAR